MRTPKQTRFNRHLRPEANMKPKPLVEAEAEAVAASIVGNIEFVGGGKAIFTVSNPQGERFTFRVKVREWKGHKYYAVGVLKGADNTNDYKGLGDYCFTRQRIVATKSTRIPLDSKETKVFNWSIEIIQGHKSPPVGYEINHAGRCCVCGRMLTTPESIKAGIGPVCAEKR